MTRGGRPPAAQRARHRRLDERRGALRALGDPDAVSFGDYHVAKDIGWAMTGTTFTDDELEEFLEP